MSSGDFVERLEARIKTLAGNWASYAALGTFALYVLGYLSLRFQVSALGVVSSDFAVLDQRYLFAGIDFLVYLVPQLPSAFVLIVLLVVLPLLLLLGLVAFGCKLAGKDVSSVAQRLRERFLSRRAVLVLAVTGLLVSVLLVQFVMRQCFAFQSLLLASKLPGSPAWLTDMLLTDSNDARVLFFIGILVATLACVVWLALLWPKLRERRVGRWLGALFAFFIVLQVLLWPANYALLAVAEKFPRVESLDGEKTLAAGEQAWLVWKGTEHLTFLIVQADNGNRSLVTVPAKDLKKIIIKDYDRLLVKLHSKL